jgi:hypothetical protein
VFPGLDELVEQSGLLDGPLVDRAGAISAVWRAARHPFDRSVLRWCLENAIALTTPLPGVRLVFYEHLFANPSTELTKIADVLELPLAPNALEMITRSSRTDYLRTSASDQLANARMADWTDRPVDERRAAGLRILEAFGLADIYGERAPLVAIDAP